MAGAAWKRPGAAEGGAGPGGQGSAAALTNGETGRERQTDRQTDRQAGRQAGRQPHGPRGTPLLRRNRPRVTPMTS